jgi:hypothetical protein
MKMNAMPPAAILVAPLKPWHNKTAVFSLDIYGGGVSWVKRSIGKNTGMEYGKSQWNTFPRLLESPIWWG